eukprot:438454-Hanusia_phi.AAC.2
MSRRLRFSIDRGGTFTDVFCKDGSDCHVLKLLSKDPAYKDAPSEGIRRVLEKVTGKSHPREAPIDTSLIASIRMGTTVATNALLERRGDPCVLLITKGFKDLLFIGNQSRPNIFDLEIKCPDVLYEQVVEVEERVCLAQEGAAPIKEGKVVRGVTGEEVEVVEELNVEGLRKELVSNSRAGGWEAVQGDRIHASVPVLGDHAHGEGCSQRSDIMRGRLLDSVDPGEEEVKKQARPDCSDEGEGGGGGNGDDGDDGDMR